MSDQKAFERHDSDPRDYHVQTKLTQRQAVVFKALMLKTRCNKAETARQLIAKGLEELQGVAL